ncbi:uncharacterized protein yc1106_05810 [Curvularia clavata]|uniref:Mediator of RNA polymerase II transcription subunit 31 n=1 Tax=Curvularia clavata TaxID=95742 RepID=A0A9Q8Z8R1_CURCL|nr:uncharacterized protein yc1106_05810 [Curvularia clavata]
MAQQSTADVPGLGGYSRFELELECLANPVYLNFLAQQKTLDRPDFVAYLAYLHRSTRTTITTTNHTTHQLTHHCHCSHPGPTLRALELLQQERFRHNILAPGLVDRLVIQGQRNAVPPTHD